MWCLLCTIRTWRWEAAVALRGASCSNVLPSCRSDFPFAPQPRALRVRFDIFPVRFPPPAAFSQRRNFHFFAVAASKQRHASPPVPFSLRVEFCAVGRCLAGNTCHPPLLLLSDSELCLFLPLFPYLVFRSRISLVCSLPDSSRLTPSVVFGSRSAGHRAAFFPAPFVLLGRSTVFFPVLVSVVGYLPSIVVGFFSQFFFWRFC